ncbi:hypothetical protein TNCV_4541501 [Trichonephila clavipes]|nr:hypothetical protein TNCV_4541501 [Trichonephila clavipes]
MGPKRDCRKRILFSDEAHFLLNGYVNKQNGRIWSEANPQVYVENPLQPEKTDCFGALYGLVESFFKNDEGHNVTVNGDRYRAMITNFFIPELNNHDDQELRNHWSMRISHKRLTIWKTTFAMLLPIYGHKCWKSHRKLDVQIGLHPSQPWQSYARNHI